MSASASQHHPHVSEVFGERRDVDLRRLRLELIHQPLQGAHLRFVGMMRREELDNLLDALELRRQRIEPRLLRLLPRRQLLGHAVKIAAAALLLVTYAARGQALHPRWEVTISGADGTEAGDLRFDGASGRVLLQHNDSAFQALQGLQIRGDRITFALARGQRRFEGTITASKLSGTVRDATGSTANWEAVPLSSPRSHRWPVAPRVVVRQLAMGSTATSERMPVAWFAGAPDSATLEREYRDLVARAGLSPMTDGDRAARSGLLSLGLDEAGRTAARDILAHILRSPAADPNFRAIFTRDGRWKIDIHDAMLWEAPHYLYGFQLLRAADGLRALHELNADAADSAVIRQSAWRLWSSVATADSARVDATIDTLARTDEGAANQLRAMLAGFDDATAWWRRAVSWLLTHPWLETPQGMRSPAQLMAAFWGVDSLPVPEIRDERFGALAAMPMLSVQHMAPFLFAPLNGSAPEWLADGGIAEAFAIWRPLRWGESPLTVVIAGRSETVASPASQALVHPASFFGDGDAIRMDPGIMPLAAVAAFLHEWNHLLAAQHRMSGVHPAALVQSPWQLQVREEDPWLAEGFAEWATEEVLRPAGVSSAFLRFTQAEKRLGIADLNDPHLLGYRLIRGAARTRRVPAFRDLLVQDLHDLPAFARAVGLPANGRGGAIVLQRPATAIVIPEVTFTWDEGTAFELSRRLVIPNIRSEH